MDYIDFHVRRIADKLRRAGVSVPGNVHTPNDTSEPQQETEFTISRGHRSALYLTHWIRDHRDDPALTVNMFAIIMWIEHLRTPQGFMDLLYAHLRDRLFADFNTDERIFIKGDTLYSHPLLTVDYTTYDLRREGDPIHLNFGNQAVMVYSPTSQGTEPWLYAHVVAIYHVFVHTVANPEPKRLELLWVRWMERDSLQLKGVNSSQYTRVSFTLHSGVPGEALGFVDPSHIIRACHLITAFDLGQTRDRLGPSIARDTKGDWQAFYTNR
jgi:hypothetical protein